MALTIWSGPSGLDPNTTICLHLTGLSRVSKNVKTGPMLQTWIMCKAEHPVLARAQGLDAAICGDCPHRAGSCYVTLARAPSAIYGNAQPWTGDLSTLCVGREVRLGAYGDPAAIPFEVWEQLLHKARGWTGYTHQWRTCDQRLKRFCMASVDSLAERDEAHDLGWRTFRVGARGELPVERETLCPASEEAGHKLQCIDCMHCSGLSANRFGDVFIPVHGSASVLRAYEQSKALRQHDWASGGVQAKDVLIRAGGTRWGCNAPVRASSAAPFHEGGAAGGAPNQEAA